MADQPGTSPVTPAECDRDARPGHALPGWRSVLAVVAHPDDESFGLGAVIDTMVSAGSAVHLLCFTHGEASTLNENGADLRAVRAAELRQASAELGMTSCTLLDYPDARLPAVAQAELEAHVAGLAARHGADGLLVFDDTGITGHGDHKAATAAAVAAASAAGLPALAWTLPAAIASQLRAETGAPFAGRPAGQVDLCIRVDRSRQRRAALRHASQISPGRCYGGGCSCRVTASTCAGSNRAAAPARGRADRPLMSVDRIGMDTGWPVLYPQGYREMPMQNADVEAGMATIEMTSENFESVVDGPGLVLVDFWAGWCGPCRMFAPVFQRVSERHPDAVFGKVDTEAQPELAGGFGVSSIPTLVIIRDRVVLYAQPGALPEQALEQLITLAREIDMDEVRASLAADPGPAEGRQQASR